MGGSTSPSARKSYWFATRKSPLHNEIQTLARRVLKNEARGLSGADEEQLNALVALGDRANDIIKLCRAFARQPVAYRWVETKLGYEWRYDEAPKLGRECHPLYEQPPAPPPLIQGHANLTVIVEAASGYSSTWEIPNVTPERYGNAMGALHGTVKIVTPEVEEKLAMLASPRAGR